MQQAQHSAGSAISAVPRRKLVAASVGPSAKSRAQRVKRQQASSRRSWKSSPASSGEGYCMAVIERIAQDMRYGARQLAATPFFTAVAAVSLGVGIAVTVTVFTFLNAVLFKPLPFPEADRVVHVYALN